MKDGVSGGDDVVALPTRARGQISQQGVSTRLFARWHIGVCDYWASVPRIVGRRGSAADEAGRVRRMWRGWGMRPGGVVPRNCAAHLAEGKQGAAAACWAKTGAIRYWGECGVAESAPCQHWRDESGGSAPWLREDGE